MDDFGRAHGLKSAKWGRLARRKKQGASSAAGPGSRRCSVSAVRASRTALRGNAASIERRLSLEVYIANDIIFNFWDLSR